MNLFELLVTILYETTYSFKDNIINFTDDSMSEPENHGEALVSVIDFQFLDTVTNNLNVGTKLSKLDFLISCLDKRLLCPAL